MTAHEPLIKRLGQIVSFQATRVQIDGTLQLSRLLVACASVADLAVTCARKGALGASTP